MNDDVLGLNHLLSFPATCQTVWPSSSRLSSGHLRIAPPQSSRVNPRCCLYHAASALWSPLVLKKTPPIPVTFAIVTPPRRYILGHNQLNTSPVATLYRIASNAYLNAVDHLR